MGCADEKQNMLIFNYAYQPEKDCFIQGEKAGLLMTLPDVNIINRKKVQPCDYTSEKQV